jgi:lactate dehydrogenase-like 2-hydroxyacid dehydrogenase
MSADELAAAMARADVLVPTVTDQIDAKLIGRADERLQLIASYGAGVDHIDLKAARAQGIIVTNTPGVLTEDTADMTMALILSVPRRLAEGEKLIREHGLAGALAECSAIASTARLWASSAWAGSGRPSRGGRRRSASRSITTSGIGCPRRSKKSWGRYGSLSSIRCWVPSTSSRSTAPTPPRPTI